jgi:hypothetical protein
MEHLMAAESIISHKKPGFPKTGNSESGTTSTVEYIGLATSINSALPLVGEEWGDYPGFVKSVSFKPTENALITDATVVVETIGDEEGNGTLAGISYEIRWVTVSRSMYEHPQFAPNGQNALTDADISDIKMWQLPDDREGADIAHNEFAYIPPGKDKGYSDKEPLSPDARLFAKGINLGQETYEDKSPVAIKESSYVNGPPPETDAGLKQEPDGIPNIPSGYEWRKEAADSTRGGNETRWTLTEEWQGAKKVLSDRDEIFWEAP